MKVLSDENVANVEDEPDLPVGVSIEGLRKVFKVSVSRVYHLRYKPTSA